MTIVLIPMIPSKVKYHFKFVFVIVVGVYGIHLKSDVLLSAPVVRKSKKNTRIYYVQNI